MVLLKWHASTTAGAVLGASPTCPSLRHVNGSDLPMVESFFQPLRGKSSSPAVHEDALTNAVNTGSSLVVFKEKQPSGSQPAKFNTQARPKAPAGYGFVSFGADEPSIPFACVEPQLFAGKDAPAKIRKLLDLAAGTFRRRRSSCPSPARRMERRSTSPLRRRRR